MALVQVLPSKARRGNNFYQLISCVKFEEE